MVCAKMNKLRLTETDTVIHGAQQLLVQRMTGRLAEIQNSFWRNLDVRWVSGLFLTCSLRVITEYSVDLAFRRIVFDW